MKGKRHPTAPIFAGFICWLLFAVSAALPAFVINTHAPGAPPDYFHYYGWALLVFGWLGPLALIAKVSTIAWADLTWLGGLAWLANPAFLVGTVAMMARGYRVAIGAGAAAVAFALMSFQVQGMYISDAVPRGPIDHYGPGFYLWLAAMALSFLAPTVFFVLTIRARQVPNEDLNQ